MNKKSISIAALVFAMCCSANANANVRYIGVTPPISRVATDKTCDLGSLDLSNVTCFEDNGKTKVRSGRNTVDGPIVMKGKTYENGVGTHADSKFVVKVNGAKSFHAVIGIDDDAQTDPGHGIVDYTVTTYNAQKQSTEKAKGTIRRTDADVVTLDIDLTDCVYLVINFDKGEEAWADHVDLGDASFTYEGTAPQLIAESDMWKDVAPVVGETCDLGSLDLSNVTCFDDNGKTQVRSGRNTVDGPIVMKGKTYENGVGTHADSKFVVKVNGAKSFHAVIGIDDDAQTDPGHGIVDYTVTTYNAQKQSTEKAKGTIRRTDADVVTLDIDLTDCVYLVINFDKGEEAWADHVDLGDASFTYEGTAPQLIAESDMWKDVSQVVNIPEASEGTENIPLSSLDLTKTTSGWENHAPKANKSIDGNAIKINGVTYASGVGTHGPSKIIIKLNGSVTDFYAVLGLDDETNNEGNFDYKVNLKSENGTIQTEAQGTINSSNRSVDIHVDVNGWKYLILETTNGNDGTNTSDHVDWANSYLVFQDQNSTRPCTVSEEEMSTKLACATTVFSQPGVRFMQKIRSTKSDAKLSVSGLPEGLQWNEKRNIIEGIVENEGTYTYNINIESEDETTTEPVTLTVSSNLQLPVPFMGWLSWNSVQSDVSEDIVKQVTDLLVNKGLYECGWNTVMMDDLWHAGSRAADGSPRPNASRFPNGLEPVSKYVHDRGMKFGLYTDAANLTCAGAFGSYGYEKKDAETYAKWGIDVVKCDYCNAPSDVESAKTRYKALADAFNEAGYGTMLYICEWGVREPWKWGAEAGGRCWRISQDVRDCWTGKDTGVGVVQSIRAMKDLSAYQGVNRFNDSDMLCTGLHATGKSSNDLCGGTGAGMTQDEYRTQFALWCMWSSPMALSFDPRSSSITEDDYNILRNKELIALNQDRMGQQADLISEDNDMIVFAKDCENGDVAVSVTNMSSTSKDFTFDFSKIPALDVETEYVARDLWANAELDNTVKGSLNTTVGTHATKVFRLSKKQIESAVNSPLSAKGFAVVPGKGFVTVKMPSTEGLNKRILVSDTEGRVIKTVTTSGVEQIVDMPTGTYVVNVTCKAQATTCKVIL